MNVARLRADTPSCEELLHFNNAGCSLRPRPVEEALLGHLALEQDAGGYEAAEAAKDSIDDFYAATADMLGCDPIEIAFQESATRAWDNAFYSLPLAEGDRVIVHASTYGSNYLALLQQARRRGLAIDVAPSNAHGEIDMEALPGLLTPNTKLVLLTHCPSQSGLINPAEAVGAFAREHGLLYLLDACQSAGQMPLDVKAIGCDALTVTGRKFLRGPRGTGFLYMRRELAETLEPATVDNVGADWTSPDDYKLAPGARRFETFERNVAGQIALGLAVRYAMDVGLDAIADRVQSLAASLREQLSDLPGVTIHDPGRHRSGIVTLSVDGRDPGELQAALRRERINTSVARRSSIRLDASARDLPDLLRASVHVYNTEVEVERIVSTLSGL